MNAIYFFADKNCSETVAPLDIEYRPVGAELFQLEMFLVDIGNEKDAWCGSLQNLSDGEKHYFKGRSELVANLQNILTPFAQLEVLKALLPTEETTDPRSDASGSAANELPGFSEPLKTDKTRKPPMILSPSRRKRSWTPLLIRPPAPSTGSRLDLGGSFFGGHSGDR